MTEEESKLVFGVPRDILDSFRQFSLQRKKRIENKKRTITSMLGIPVPPVVPGPANQPQQHALDPLEEIPLVLDGLNINGKDVIQKKRTDILLVMSSNTPSGHTMISLLTARKDPTTVETERWDRKNPITHPILIRAGWSTTTRRGSFGLRIRVSGCGGGINLYDVNMEFENDLERNHIHDALSSIENNKSPTPSPGSEETSSEGSDGSEPETPGPGDEPLNKRCKTSTKEKSSEGSDGGDPETPGPGDEPRHQPVSFSSIKDTTPTFAITTHNSISYFS